MPKTSMHSLVFSLKTVGKILIHTSIFQAQGTIKLLFEKTQSCSSESVFSFPMGGPLGLKLLFEKTQPCSFKNVFSYPIRIPLIFLFIYKASILFFWWARNRNFLDFSFIPRKSKPSENKNLRQFSAVNVPISELL